MTKPSQRLQTVLKLARLRQQQAAGRLRQRQRAVDAQVQQMQQLQSFQNDYNEQFKCQDKQPVNAQQLSNYMVFFNNLGDIIKIQNKNKMTAEEQLEQTRSHWRATYSRQKNLEELIDRKKQQEAREQENKRQRILDDRINNKQNEP